MGQSTKESWLTGGDLREAVVEDVPVKGDTVRVRGLPATYSNQAQSEAMEMVSGRRGEQIARVNTARLEELQFLHGVVEPKFGPEDVKVISTLYGPAWRKVIEKIDELSGVDKEAIERAEARFQPGGEGANGSDVADAATRRGG